MRTDYELHAMRQTPEYVAWNNMIQRCHNANNPQYVDYGARGITVCDRWRNSFVSFFEDMGPRPTPDHTLDRRDGSKGYSKNNCRWATWVEQGRNRFNNRLVEHEGKQVTVSELSEITGIPVGRLFSRLNNGHPLLAEKNSSRPPPRKYEFRGESKTLREWAESLELPYHTLYTRIEQRKWPVEKAFTTPTVSRGI